MRKRTIAAGMALPLASLLAACGSNPPTGGIPSYSDNVTIVLDTPQSALPYVAKFTLQGAQLAADEINRAGGIKVGGKAYGVKLEQKDNALSPTTALANVNAAIGGKAVAVIDDGYTVSSTFDAANRAGLPILVDYNSEAQLIDTDKRPNVFRITPPNDAMAAKLAPYVAAHGKKFALVTDDSSYGVDGAAQLTDAMAKAGLIVSPKLTLPSNATEYATQALQVKQAGVDGVVLWARAPVLAGFLRALRAGGSSVPVYSGPTAEDPVVRDQLASVTGGVEGLTYASFRITTETGPESWDAFRKKYEDHNFNDNAPDFHVGVKAKDGKDVVQPPDWQIFPYDMVYLVKAAILRAGTVDTAGGKLIDALDNVQIKSANGDNRGWKKDNHEGVVDDDIYFATFSDNKFKPVQDDPLSKSLPPIDQE